MNVWNVSVISCWNMEYGQTLKALIHRLIYFTNNKQGCKSIFKPNDMKMSIDRWSCWQTQSTV